MASKSTKAKIKQQLIEDLNNFDWESLIDKGLSQKVSTDKNPQPIMLVDTSVLAYLINDKLKVSMQYGAIQGSIDYDTLLKLKPTVQALMAGFIGCHFWQKRLPMIFLKDDPSRNYWRKVCLDPFGISYKGQRYAARQNDAQKRDSTVDFIKETMYNILIKYRIPQLMLPDFEADDLAGAFVKKYPDQEFELFTVDSDWIGLVNPIVNWNNFVRQKVKRVTLGNHHTLDKDWNKWQEYQQPRDIWRYKSVYGDPSDNLPEQTPIGLIDLIDPYLSPLTHWDHKFDHFDIANLRYHETTNPSMYLARVGCNMLGFDTLTTN